MIYRCNTLIRNYIDRSVVDCVYPEYQLSVVRDSKFTLRGIKVLLNKLKKKYIETR